jgi:hypothetical protein
MIFRQRKIVAGIQQLGTNPKQSRLHITPAAMIIFGFLWPFSFISLLSVIDWILQLHQISGPINTQTLPPWRQSDFPMFWTAGHFAAGPMPGQAYIPHRLLDLENKRIFGHKFFGNKYSDPFVYPPPSLMLTMLIGRLGYWPAFTLWTMALSAIGATCLRVARLPWLVVIAAFLSPCSLFVLMTGQLSIVSGCFFVASLLMIDTKPMLAGGFSAMTIFKPQAALLGPIAFLARRRWRGVGAGLVTAISICIITSWALGPDIWKFYLDQGSAASKSLLHLPFPKKFDPKYEGNFEYETITVFYFFRSLNLGLTIAFIGQALSSIVAAAVCLRLWAQEHHNALELAPMTVFLGLLATPYASMQDMFAFSLAIIIMIWRRKRLDAGDVILLMYPAFVIFGNKLTDIDIGPFFVLFGIIRARSMLWNNTNSQTA